MARCGRHRALLVLAVFAARAAAAQPPSGQVLLGVNVDASHSGWRVEVRLDRPFRFLRHSPPERGALLRIELEALPLGGAGTTTILPRRETSPAPRVGDCPLRDVTWDATVSERPVIELRFARPAHFQVSQGADFRSVVVTIAATPRPAPSEPTPLTTEAESDDRLLVEARRAITDGELDRAILLLNKSADGALGRGDDATAAAAKELLGLVHERRAQRSHARAEYEEILERWPDSAVAGRVRQRLDALLLVQAPSREPLREAEPPDDAIDSELYGSLAATYSRIETIDDVTGGRVLDSSAITDVSAVARLESTSLVLRGEVVASYRYDFLEGARGDDTRISTLLVRAGDTERTLVGTLGRQSRSNGGVLGRFDGAHIAYRFGERSTLSVLAGLPLASSSTLSVQTDEILFGAAIDVERLPFDLDGQLFVVGQRDQGLTDRVAIGGELRYARPGFFGLAFLDYDVYFQSLNTALLTGNITLRDRTDLNVLLETRNAPILTLGNAVIGQPVRDLDDLRTLFGTKEIRDLAEDRTARSWTSSLGLTHRLNDRLQLSGDVTLSGLSSTATSGGVLGTSSTGPDTSFGVQATRSNFLRSGGFGTVSLRYFDGETTDTTSILATARLPVTDRLRLTARVRADHRNGPQDQVAVRPSLRADWRVWQLYVDAELGIDWIEGLGGATGLDELGYFGELVIRWDF